MFYLLRPKSNVQFQPRSFSIRLSAPFKCSLSIVPQSEFIRGQHENMATNGEPVDKSSATSVIGDSSPHPSFIHTPFYCEENVYLLCKQLCKSGIADQKGIDLFVVFISNEEKKIPLWCQKASKRSDGLVMWDYHVICIQLQKNDEGNDHHMVWDLDSSLPCPMPLKHYITETILTPFPINPTYGRIFRVVHAPIFLQCFASDRSHMKDPLGNWISPPPGYKAIVAEDGTENNLNQYLQMSAFEIKSDVEAWINGVYSNKYGVLICEATLEGFFSQIHPKVAFSSLCQ